MRMISEYYTEMANTFPYLELEGDQPSHFTIKTIAPFDKIKMSGTKSEKPSAESVEYLKMVD